MSSVFQTAQRLVEYVNVELKNFFSDVNVHMVWLQEIQQEAYRMFSSDFSTEPELMPKTPSQKKTNRRRLLSVELNESRSKRRFSKGKRSNLRGSSVQSSLSSVSELESVRRTRRQRDTCEAEAEPLQRSTRSKATETPQEPEEEEPEEEELSAPLMLSEALEKGPGADAVRRVSARRSLVQRRSLVALRHSLTQDAVRRASRRSFLKKKAAKLSNSTCSSAFSDAQPEDTEVDAQEPVDAEPDTKPPAIILPSDPEPAAEEENEENHSEPEATSPAGEAQKNSCFTRSMKRQSDSSSTLTTEHHGKRKSGGEERLTRSGSKRRVLEEVSTPKSKNPPPGKKCLTSVAPHMRTFVHTLQKNQMLMTPGSLGRSSVMKSLIKVPRVDVKVGSGSVEQERQKWDAFNKKIELENERKKKMEEEKRKKQEEMKRKRDERVKRVVETRVKVEKVKELEKKKKIEEKMALLEKKSDMLRVERMAEEKNKKMVATKRQEELELRKKREEAARLKKLQQVEEEERRHQEMLSARKAEEEREKARKQAEAARALELKKEQEREKEIEREREREKERLETEKKELELRRKMMEEQKRVDEEKEAERRLAAAALVPPAGSAQVLKTPAGSVFNQTITKSPALNLTFDLENSLLRTPLGKGAAQNQTMDAGAGLNVTVDIEKSPQTYQITPRGQKVSALVNPEDYGMDQQSDDSTDDESDPKKPIPSWAQGTKLQQTLMRQYYQPLDLDSYFGEPEPPRLEDIFSRAKPRFFKRTSSAVWHTPPNSAL